MESTVNSGVLISYYITRNLNRSESPLLPYFFSVGCYYCRSVSRNYLHNDKKHNSVGTEK